MDPMAGCLLHKSTPIMQWQIPHNCSWMVSRIMNVREIVHDSSYKKKSLQNGKFQTTTMYKDIRGEEANASCKKLFFRNHARSRACFTVLLVMLGRIG